MNEAQKSNRIGGAIFAACLGIPLLGCALAVYFKEPSWLVLLAPLFVFMEGALVLIPLAYFVTMLLIERPAAQPDDCPPEWECNGSPATNHPNCKCWDAR